VDDYTSQKRPNRAVLTVADLFAVVHSSGKVFDGLRVSKVDTESFLRSGSLEGVTSRADLALLEDLRDMSQYLIDDQEAPIGATYVCQINAQITRSGPLHPGKYRTDGQNIGVNTQHGRHEPRPIEGVALQQIIDDALAQPSPRERALELFVQIAKAQPFEDGNKRTALFVANSLLIRQTNPELLVVPVEKATQFNDLLAQAYIYNDDEGVKGLLRSDGFVGADSNSGPNLEAVE
jgi:Fic family protein